MLALTAVMTNAGALAQKDLLNGDLAGILDIYFHVDHPERILFTGPAFNHWVTSDYGITYTKVG
jgi:hypothetical protein